MPSHKRVTIPEEFRQDSEAFPPALRALLDAELAAGNNVVDVGHSFPAPPAGAFIKLAKPVSTQPRESGNGIDFYDRNSSIYSGEFTDAKRFFFILEPPHPPPPELDMDAIRAHHSPPGSPPVTPAPWSQPAERKGEPETPLGRFKSSMIVDYEKWHDGVGYDLEALRGASAEERAAIEMLLIGRGASDWRDVEALAALDTPRARAALRAALKSSDHQVRAAVLRCAPQLVPDATRTRSLVMALESADLYGGLTQALDHVEDFHPPEVVDALLRGTLGRDGDIAVNFAAMLLFVHGKAEEPFDWAQRPFFLRFQTQSRIEREAVFRELCVKIGIDASRYLK